VAWTRYKTQPKFDDTTDLPKKYAGQRAVGLEEKENPVSEGTKNRPYRHGTGAPDLMKAIVRKLEDLGPDAEFYDLGAGRGYLLVVLRMLGFQRVGGCELLQGAVEEANELGRTVFHDHWCDVQHAAIGQVRFETRRPRLFFVNNEVFSNDGGLTDDPWLLRGVERMMIEDCAEGSTLLAVRPLAGCKRSLVTV